MQDQVEEFLQFLAVEKGRSRHTVAAYRNDLSQFLRYVTGRGVSVWQDVDQRCVWDYVLGLVGERGYTPATARRRTAALRSFFRFLVADGVLVEDPTTAVPAPRVDRRLGCPVGSTEVAKLLAEASRSRAPKGLRDWALLELMCATGMRAGEAIRLQIDAVDLEAGAVRCGGGGHERVVPLGRRAGEVLRAYLEQGRPKLLKDKSEPALFVNHRGKPLTRQGLWSIIRNHAAAAGIEEITPRALRHFFAVRLLDCGADLEELQRALGYANRSSARAYARIFPGVREEGRLL